MELKDLVLKRFRVEKLAGKMVAILDPSGNYKAISAEAVERALNSSCRIRRTDNVFVKSTTGRVWHHILREKGIYPIVT